MNTDLPKKYKRAEEKKVKRERFETTLKPELKQKLKIAAIKRNMDINEMIEEWIQDLPINVRKEK